MTTQSDDLLRSMRLGLAHAYLLQREGHHELAAAACARAANKLALAVELERRAAQVIPLRPKESNDG